MLREPTQEASIAVIDDEESMREGCRQTLEAEGYRTTVAEDGERGLRLVEEIKPDVVLVDLKMPGMSGMEVLQRINEIAPDTIRIVITGYGTIESAVTAMREGTFDYLTKPFGPEKLLEVVASAIDRSVLQRRSAAMEQEKEIALDNFAAVVCHQLRSPAADAAQYIEVLSKELAGPLTTKQRSMLHRAYQLTENLTKLVGDWLNLARLESGALPFEPQSVALPRVIEDNWQAIPDGEGRVVLELHVEPDVKPVRGEENLLRELFKILLTNAVQFTSDSGRVIVKLSAEGKHTVVSVSDTGTGIPEEELPHVFEPFYRGARAAEGGEIGFGIGLAIAKRIVSLHDGAIRAASAPGRGTTFTLRLPTEAGVYLTPIAPPAFVPVEPRPAVETATKALSAQQLANFVERMIAEQPVAGVKAKEDRFVFGPLESASELRLNYDVTLLPPKKYLQPPRDTLVRFKLHTSPVAEPCVEPSQPTVIIGVHPYDMIAINQLDRLMSETNPDPNYLTRRSSLAIIGVDPKRASERAFWGAMGCSVVNEGFDLWLSEIRGTYVVEIGSEKGAALLEKYAEARKATVKELAARSMVRDRLKELGTPREVNFSPAELPALLRRSIEDRTWEEKAQKCLSCGSCNLVCPTCYCFDVKDETDVSLKEGERYRVWDGCMLEDFAKVATGENFRKERLQRYRHRFYRKGLYLHDKNGQIACVGCGRCATACLPDIADPVAVFNALSAAQRKVVRHRVAANRKLYTPDIGTIRRVEQLGDHERLFEIQLDNGRRLDYRPGQFVQVSVLGVGEAPISISSSPSRDSGNFELAVRRVGNVTAALHRLQRGGKVGIRGPFGTTFPIEDMKGHDLLFVAGGIGLFPLRSAINEVLHSRNDFGRVIILYGAKTPSERMFAAELEQWRKREDVEYLETVDRTDESWKGNVGVITTLFPKISVAPKRTYCLVVGPSIMQRFVVLEAKKKGLPDNRIILSLERHMKCGVGKCGHCQINHLYVCQDGPVFRYSEILALPEAL